MTTDIGFVGKLYIPSLSQSKDKPIKRRLVKWNSKESMSISDVDGTYVDHVRCFSNTSSIDRNGKIMEQLCKKDTECNEHKFFALVNSDGYLIGPDCMGNNL